MDRDFARFGLENETFDADYVADVEFFERLIFVNAHIVAAEIALHSSVVVHNVTETCLAHNALGHKSARDADFFALEFVVVCENLSCRGSAFVRGDFKRIFALLYEFVEFCDSDLAYLVDVYFFFLFGSIVADFFTHCISLYKKQYACRKTTGASAI